MRGLENLSLFYDEYELRYGGMCFDSDGGTGSGASAETEEEGDRCRRHQNQCVTPNLGSAGGLPPSIGRHRLLDEPVIKQIAVFN